MRVKFLAKYDHTWPSRAVTAYPAGWEGTVKREVFERAKRQGKVEALKGGETTDEPPETLPGNLDTGLAEPQALTPNLHVDDNSDSK